MRGKIAFRFAASLMSVLLVTVGIYFVWSIQQQQTVSERQVLGEARLLNEQMISVWDYINDVQENVNYNHDGSYDFKGIYCSVAGKNIAQRFSLRTDCEIRYTKENPRTAMDTPDTFEKVALEAFENGEVEYFGVEDYNGVSSFRYVSALKIEYGCLKCHGYPAGELDEVGYKKEGMQLGDLAGAVSMIIPMEQYQQEAASAAGANILLFIALAVTIIACMSYGLHRWVTSPLAKLTKATEAIASGEFNSSQQLTNEKDEIASLAASFSTMEKQLEESYSVLEKKVYERTEELLTTSEEMEKQRDKISQMNGTLLTMNDQLKNDNEHKSIFLATMSHELRTPLTSIIAFTNMWIRASTDKDERDIKLVEEIKRNSDALLDTIEKTLDAARIEANQITVNKTSVDLLEVAYAVEQVIAPLAEEKEIRLVIDIDSGIPFVMSDPSILKKILNNLVGNAVKFTEKNGAITVSIKVDTEQKFVQMGCMDTGIGIPPDDLEVIFHRFTQSDPSLSRKYGGSGLGLFLVKEMTELLGGEARVESIVGEGSVFTIKIPYEQPKEDNHEDHDR